MCNRSVGLAARAIEAAGVATTSISIVREITETTPPPRALVLRWPFGHALGEPGARWQQLTVLAKTLELLFTVETPGTLEDGGLRWRRETYEEPEWERLENLGLDE